MGQHTSTWVLVAHPSVAARSVVDLIALTKAEPDKLNYASAGLGGSHHVVMEMFKSATGAKMVHVPYRGAGAALVDVEAGQVQVMFSALSVALGRIRDGKVIALAVASPTRSPLLPDVPTVAESGVPGFRFATWTGMLAPKGTPAAVIDRLNAEIARALGDPEVAGRLAALGATPQPGTPQALRELIESTTATMSKVIREAKISAQ